MGDPPAALEIAAMVPGDAAIRSEPDFEWMLASVHFLSHDFAAAEKPLLDLFRSLRASANHKAAESRLALPPPHRQVLIGLVASDLPANSGVAAPGAPTERLLREYAAEAEALASRGAKVIVLPEHLGAIEDRPHAQSADAIFQVLADNTNATIVAGVSQASPPAKYNQARIYAPGTAVLTYDKHHLLPPVEFMFTPGKTLTVLREPSAIWGVAICKDMDFAGLSRNYGAAGVGLMLVPAWDFDLDRLWHGHIAVMRGVEDGFSVARAARNGYLTVSDDRGRILAEVRSDRSPFATLMALAPATHDPTPYLLFGDWFAWLTLAALVFTLVQLIRLRILRPQVQEAIAD